MMAEPKFRTTPAAEFLDCVGEDQEVAIACPAQRCAVEIRMLMQDVVADSDVDCHRDIIAVRGRKDTQVFVWIMRWLRFAGRRSLRVRVADPRPVQSSR